MSDGGGDGGGGGYQHDRRFMEWLASVGTAFAMSVSSLQQVVVVGLTKRVALPKDEEAAKQATPVGSPALALDMLVNCPRPMGLHASRDGGDLWTSEIAYLTRFTDRGQSASRDPQWDRYDATYVPRQRYTIDDVDVHDLVVQDDGLVLFVSATYSCLCELSESASFAVHWQPPWITKVAAEDRCHLNGVGLRDGVARYVTAASDSNIVGGWREKREAGGVVYDIVEQRFIVRGGLSMPHSPRWFDGTLFILESGTGHLCTVDVGTGAVERRTFVPGFVRGLTFVHDERNHPYAVVATSKDRHEAAFSGLELSRRLQREGLDARCGLFVIDLKTFDQVHYFEFNDPVREIYDVAALGERRAPTRAYLAAFAERKFARNHTVEQLPDAADSGGGGGGASATK